MQHWLYLKYRYLRIFHRFALQRAKRALTEFHQWGCFDSFLLCCFGWGGIDQTIFIEYTTKHVIVNGACQTCDVDVISRDESENSDEIDAILHEDAIIADIDGLSPFINLTYFCGFKPSCWLRWWEWIGWQWNRRRKIAGT